MDGLTAEQSLLLKLLRTDAAPSWSNPPIDWYGFQRLVRGLGLGPYLARAAGTAALPGPIRAELYALSCANAILHLRRQSLFEKLASEFAEQSIPVLVVKGMALAHICYPEPASRPMSDIDFMVKPEHLERAAGIARSLGFRESANTQRIRKICTEERDEVFGLISPDGKVQLEFHASLPSFNKIGIPAAGLWERSIPVQLGAAKTYTLGTEDFLHHLCLHLGAHHRYLSRLLGLLDIVLFVAAKQIDWQRLAEESKRVSSDRSLYLTLSLALELLGASVPSSFFASLPSPPRITHMRSLATGQLFFLSNLPVATRVVQLGSSPSFRALRRSLVNHLEASGAADARRADLRTGIVWIKDYFNYFAHRAMFFVRAGILKPSSWRGVAECQRLREELAQWMSVR